MHDVEEALTEQHTKQIPWIHSEKQPLFDLAYADDTVLLGKSAESVQNALHHLQHIAQQSNLKLNLGKCELIRLNCTGSIYFTDNTKVTAKPKAKYL